LLIESNGFCVSFPLYLIVCYLVDYTHRSSLPGTGRVLPVTPSALTSTPSRNSRTLPMTPAGSSAMQVRTSGRTLPVVPNLSVHNQKHISGRTLPTTPSNTSGRLPMSAAGDHHRSQLPKKSTQSQREFQYLVFVNLDR